MLLHLFSRFLGWFQRSGYCNAGTAFLTFVIGPFYSDRVTALCTSYADGKHGIPCDSGSNVRFSDGEAVDLKDNLLDEVRWNHCARA